MMFGTWRFFLEVGDSLWKLTNIWGVHLGHPQVTLGVETIFHHHQLHPIMRRDTIFHLGFPLTPTM